jgi:solute carrier family 35 protein F1/2
MAITGADAKSTAIETHDTKLANEDSNELGNGSNEVSVEGQGLNGSEEAVDEGVLERGIEALEAKKTKWWAYLATRDFWFVLLLGYVFDSIAAFNNDLN